MANVAEVFELTVFLGQSRENVVATFTVYSKIWIKFELEKKDEEMHSIMCFSCGMHSTKEKLEIMLLVTEQMQWPVKIHLKSLIEE